MNELTQEAIELIKNYVISQYYDITGAALKVLPPNSTLKKKSKSGLISSSTKFIPINYQDLMGKQSDEAIRNFENILNAYFSHCDLSCFYKNIQTLKKNFKGKNPVEKFLDKFKTFKIGGFYSSSSNKIRIYDDDDFSATLCHELLHMASSSYSINYDQSGFELSTSKLNKIGEALNEGYTEYLNTKYFSYDYQNYSYPDQVPFAFAIEKLIGHEKMEQLYFTHDLNGLLQELSRYTTRDKAIELLLKMDKTLEIRKKTENSPITQKLHDEVRIDIANMLNKKQQQKYEQGEINLHGFKRSLFDNLLFCFGYNGISYQFKKIDESQVDLCSVTIGDDIFNIVKSGHRLSPKEYFDRIDSCYEAFKSQNFQFPYDIVNQSEKYNPACRKFDEYDSQDSNLNPVNRDEKEDLNLMLSEAFKKFTENKKSEQKKS